MNRTGKSITSIGLAALIAACSSTNTTTQQNGGSGGASVASSGGSAGTAKGGAGGSGTGGSLSSGLGGNLRGGSGGGATGGASGGSGGRLTGGSGASVTGGTSGGSGGGAAAGAGGTMNPGTGGSARGGSDGGMNGGASGGLGGSTGAGGTGGSTDVCPSQAQACYYVSPSGSDTNDGSAAASFQTITKARDVVSTVNTNMTGDIYVYLRGGDYRITSPITFAVKDSGTGNHRIYYQGYPGETPIINGAQKVTGWTASSGGAYKATLDRKTKLRNLYVNDTRANMTSKTVSSKGGTGT